MSGSDAKTDDFAGLTQAAAADAADTTDPTDTTDATEMKSSDDPNIKHILWHAPENNIKKDNPWNERITFQIDGVEPISTVEASSKPYNSNPFTVLIDTGYAKAGEYTEITNAKPVSILMDYQDIHPTESKEDDLDELEDVPAPLARSTQVLGQGFTEYVKKIVEEEIKPKINTKEFRTQIYERNTNWQKKKKIDDDAYKKWEAAEKAVASVICNGVRQPKWGDQLLMDAMHRKVEIKIALGDTRIDED